MTNAKGVDVSHWQDRTPDLTGKTFLIAKASEGTGFIDPKYKTHIANARAAGLIVGAYAFNAGDEDPAAQAEVFAKAAGDVDLYAIDVEGSNAFTHAQTRTFINRFRAVTGKPIGLYASESVFFDVGQDWNWIAHWGVGQPDRAWDIHQYRGTPLDLDQFNGTPEEMRAWVAALNRGSRVDTFTVPEVRTLAKVKTSAWLYDNSDLTSSSGNIRIDPGRELVYVGRFSTTPDIRIVAYEPAEGDAGSTSKAMFCAATSVESYRAEPDETPFDQSDIESAIAGATAPLEQEVEDLQNEALVREEIIAGLQQTVDDQAAIIASLKTDLAASQALLLESQAAMAVCREELRKSQADLAVASAVVGEYETLRGALRKAVAP